MPQSPKQQTTSHLRVGAVPRERRAPRPGRSGLRKRDASTLLRASLFALVFPRTSFSPGHGVAANSGPRCLALVPGPCFQSVRLPEDRRWTRGAGGTHMSPGWRPVLAKCGPPPLPLREGSGTEGKGADRAPSVTRADKAEGLPLNCAPRGHNGFSLHGTEWRLLGHCLVLKLSLGRSSALLPPASGRAPCSERPQRGWWKAGAAVLLSPRAGCAAYSAGVFRRLSAAEGNEAAVRGSPTPYVPRHCRSGSRFRRPSAALL